MKQLTFPLDLDKAKELMHSMQPHNLALVKAVIEDPIVRSYVEGVFVTLALGTTPRSAITSCVALSMELGYALGRSEAEVETLNKLVSGL